MLPEVGSTIVPPGRSRPSCSAASIIARPMRSLTEPPGFRNSSFARSSPGTSRESRSSRTIGVEPTSSRTVGYSRRVIGEAYFRRGSRAARRVIVPTRLRFRARHANFHSTLLACRPVRDPDMTRVRRRRATLLVAIVALAAVAVAATALLPERRRLRSSTASETRRPTVAAPSTETPPATHDAGRSRHRSRRRPHRRPPRARPRPAPPVPSRAHARGLHGRRELPLAPVPSADARPRAGDRRAT